MHQHLVFARVLLESALCGIGGNPGSGRAVLAELVGPMARAQRSSIYKGGPRTGSQGPPAAARDLLEGHGRSGRPCVNLYYCRVDKMSSAIGGGLGRALKIPRPQQRIYWKAVAGPDGLV